MPKRKSFLCQILNPAINLRLLTHHDRQLTYFLTRDYCLLTNYWLITDYWLLTTINKLLTKDWILTSEYRLLKLLSFSSLNSNLVATSHDRLLQLQISMHMTLSRIYWKKVLSLSQYITVLHITSLHTHNLTMSHCIPMFTKPH